MTYELIPSEALGDLLKAIVRVTSAKVPTLGMAADLDEAHNRFEMAQNVNAVDLVSKRIVERLENARSDWFPCEADTEEAIEIVASELTTEAGAHRTKAVERQRLVALAEAYGAACIRWARADASPESKASALEDFLEGFRKLQAT